MKSHASALCRRSRTGIATALSCLAILLVVVGSPSFGQESIVVAAQYSRLSLYDLNTLSVSKSFIAAGTQTWVLVSPNRRLAFVGASSYIAVIDLALGHEVTRISGICAYDNAALSLDGKLLLVEDDCSETLDLVDTTSLKLLAKVPLAPVMGDILSLFGFGSVVVAENTAYVTALETDSAHPALAAVDLQRLVVTPVPIPDGYTLGAGPWMPNAAATADGKYVAFVEARKSDDSQHLFLVDTTSKEVVLDTPLDTFAIGLVIPAKSQLGGTYGYLISFLSAMAIDLNPGSPTFGRPLPQTEVDLTSTFTGLSTSAINAAGTRLMVGGRNLGKNLPNPNMVVLDTARMFSDPAHAILGRVTVAGGVQLRGSLLATITTVSPPTAPTVTSVSGPITNDQSNNVHITGTNFAAGAQVRIGSMLPIVATVNSSTSLNVTVPKDSPAAPNLDVVVTNPNLSRPPAQQYQSGLLKGGLGILATPAFQPRHQFAVYGSVASVSVFDFVQRAMLYVPNPLSTKGITYNLGGDEIYAAGNGPRGIQRVPEAVAFNPPTGRVQAQVLLPNGTALGFGVGPSAIAAAVNPTTGKSVVWVPAIIPLTNGGGYFVVDMVDSDSSSPTFNQVIRSIPDLTDANVYAQGVTPDGKFVYVGYQSLDDLNGYIAIFDVLAGTVSSVRTSSLGVAEFQFYNTYVTPDGKSLLVSGYSSDPASSPIAILDIGVDPKHPTLIATISGTGPPHPGPAFFVSWQVVGKHLFALEANRSAMMAYNFDRSTSNFSRLSAYVVSSGHDLGGYFGISPDGALLYVPVYSYDRIAVLNTNLLINNRPPLITNIGSFLGPDQVAVSPVVH